MSCSSKYLNWRGSCWPSILNRQKHRQLPELVIGVWLRGVLFCRTKSLTCGIWYYLWVDSGEGNGNPFQYSCLENPMDRGTWRTIVHGVARVRYHLANESSKSHSLQHYISFFIQTWRRKTETATKIGGKEDTESLCIYHLNRYNQAPPNGLPHLCTCLGNPATSDWGTVWVWLISSVAEGAWQQVASSNPKL